MAKQRTSSRPRKAWKALRTLSRVLGFFLLTVVGLVVIASIAILHPAVQKRLGQYAAERLSDKLGTEVKVEGLFYAPLWHLSLKGVSIKDQRQQTLLSARTITFDIADLFANHLDGDYGLNYLALDSADIRMGQYAGEKSLNFMFIARAFSSKSVKSTGKSPSIFVRRLTLTNTRYRYFDARISKMAGVPTHYGDLDATGLELDANAIAIVGDSLRADVKHLSFKEQGGAQVKHLQTQFSYSSQGLRFKKTAFQTQYSRFVGSVEFEYDSVKNLSRFLTEVRLKVEVDSSLVDPRDLRLFAPNLERFQQPARFQGVATGPISNLRIRTFAIRFGSQSALSGRLAMRGLPAAFNTNFQLDLRQARLSAADAEAMLADLTLPEATHKLGSVGIQGSFTGFLRDFVTEANFQTKLGSFQSDLNLKLPVDGPARYRGDLSAANFQAGALLPHGSNIGMVAFKSNLDGQGFDWRTAIAKASAKVNTFTYKNYPYHDLTLSADLKAAEVTGALVSKDVNAQLAFNGTLNLKDIKEPFVQARLDIANFDAQATQFVTQPWRISGGFMLNAKGGSLDKFSGTATADTVLLSAGNRSLRIKRISLFGQRGEIDSSDLTAPIERQFRLVSDFGNINLRGDFDFATLGQAFNDYYAHYTASKPYIRPLDNLRFDINLNHTQPLIDLAIPEIGLELDSISLSGQAGGKQGQAPLRVGVLKIPYLAYQGIRMAGIDAKAGSPGGDTLSYVLHIDAATYGRFYLDSIAATSTIVPGNYSFDLALNSDSNPYRARFAGDVSLGSRFRALDLTGSTLFFNQLPWSIKQAGPLQISDQGVLFDSLAITAKPIFLPGLGFTKPQSVSLNGLLGHEPEDIVSAGLRNVDLSLINPFIGTRVALEGRVNGSVRGLSVLNRPQFVANADIKNLGVNGYNLGELNLHSAYMPEMRRIFSTLTLTNENISLARAEGFIIASKEGQSPMQFDISLNRTSITPLQSFFNGIFDEVKGTATAQLMLAGTIEEPRLTGYADVDSGSIRIPYTGVKYTFADRIILEEDEIAFDDIVASDGEGGKARVLGAIRHSHFSDFYVDMEVTATKLKALNTTASDNALYYGKARGTGSLRLLGPFEDLDIQMRAKTEEGTSLVLPLQQAGAATTQSVVTYRTKTGVKQEVVVPKTLEGVHFAMDLEVTPDAEATIIVDPIAGDYIRGRGISNLQLDITPTGKFTMIGTYRLTEGEYFFTFQNILNKRFTIDKGSTLTWNGDPYEAVMDIRAAYRVRASVTSLLESSGNTDSTQAANYSGRRIPIEVDLLLKGMLTQPTIDFAIEAPQANQADLSGFINTELQSINANDAVLKQQVFGLLLLGQFINTTPSGVTNTTGTGLVSTAAQTSITEVLSNQLSNFLSTYTGKLDVGVNYQGADAAGARSIQLALSTKLLNDRITVQSNVGLNGTQPSTTTAGTTTQNFGGDFSVSYRPNQDRNINLTAFNRQEERATTLGQGSFFRQGVGIVYRGQFNTFGELLLPARRKLVTLENKGRNFLHIKPREMPTLSETDTAQSPVKAPVPLSPEPQPSPPPPAAPGPPASQPEVDRQKELLLN